MPRPSIAFAATALLAPALAAAPPRWDSIPSSPAHPILNAGSCVVHDNGANVFAFAATTQRFVPLAPTGSPIVGLGDHVAVVRVGSNVYRAWSARRNEFADSAQNLPLVHSAFGDDVALLVFGSQNGFFALAYSAVTNQWKSLFGAFPAGAAADNAAVSDFVVALRTTAGVHGFAARKGEWVALPSSAGAGPPQAKGNVAVATGPIGGGGALATAAFSGVLGTWATSSPLAGADTVLLDHNVAMCRAAADVGPAWRAQAYSAYNGRWVLSSHVHASAATAAVHVSANIVTVASSSDSPPGVEAFGARPGQTFAFLPSNIGGLYMPIGDDYLIANPVLGGKTVHVFSGLCGGTFLPYTFSTTFSGGFAGGHQFIAVDTGGTLVGYAPAKHAFATRPLPAAYDVALEEALSEVRQYGAGGAVFHGFAARHGHFTSSAPQEPGASYATASSGSLIARRQLGGAAAGSILVYDERCDRYPTPFQPGGAAALGAGRNVLVAALDAAPHTVFGYSVARADWSAAGAAAGAPLAAPVVDADVAWFIDAAFALHAFGGDGDMHAYYGWPNDTEFQTFGVSGQFATPASPLALAAAGETGDVATLLLAFGTVCPGLPVGGVQNPLFLDPASLQVLGPLGAIGGSRVLTFSGSGPLLPAPACAEIWVQELLTGGPSGNWLGQRSDALWFL